MVSQGLFNFAMGLKPVNHNAGRLMADALSSPERYPVQADVSIRPVGNNYRVAVESAQND